MSRSNTSSWFPMEMFIKDPAEKKACKGVMFGPAKQAEHLNYPYPNEFVKKDETVLWNPELHKTVSLKSYEKAHQEQDVEALGKISKIGIPLDCTFGGSISLKKEY